MTIPVPSLTILVSAVLVLSCGQTDRHTESQTEADRYTRVTTIVVSNYVIYLNALNIEMKCHISVLSLIAS